jgi:hypothetical protein
MSAMPAEVTQLSEGSRPPAVPVLALRRAERRAARKLARRSQQRWAVLSCSILGSAFALTVGILDVLH